MFDTFYKYHYCTSRIAHANEDFIRLHILTFKGKGRHRYIVLVEEYPQNIFVIKFFLKNHRNSQNKYNLLSGNNDVQAVLRTCINIMIDEFYAKNPLASFGFIGAPTMNEEKSEKTTKRYELYRKLMVNFFSIKNYIHYPIHTHNAYFLLSRANSANLDLNTVERQLLRMIS